jgi:hypothetical protein
MKRDALHMAGIKSEQCNESVSQDLRLLAPASLRITGGIDLLLHCVMLLRDYQPLFLRVGDPSSL